MSRSIVSHPYLKVRTCVQCAVWCPLIHRNMFINPSYYAFSGKNCIGCAKTGSGKTAAFALPILHRLAEDPYGVFALVITPTR